MQLPTLAELPAVRSVTEIFGGYNHNLRIGEGEFYDMKNLTSDYYPLLSPRDKRGTYISGINPQGLEAKDALCYIDGEYFVIGNERVDMRLSVNDEDCPKTLVSMGAYIIILPDKKYINTADLTEYGKIEADYTTNGTVTFELCRADGGEVNVTYTQTTEPESPSNAEYWLDTSSAPNTLKQYSETSGIWAVVPTVYIKISSAGIGAAFKQYDGVTITGLKDAELTDHESGDTFEDKDINAIDGNFVLWDRGDDYIVIIGMLGSVRTIDNAVTVKREMPKLDFVIESENRLWGCRYGMSAAGKFVNEIYASKLGDFKNWNCFMGMSTDSYAVSLGTDGQFTGAFTYLGNPVFFKESCIHKIFGSFPANYQVQTTACRGVQKGSHRSLAMVNETLFYKSRLGVCAYDGSLPVEISAALGEEFYSEAVGGAHGNKYYISMKDSRGRYSLFVFDAAKKMWHREDETQAEAFCSCINEMYYIDGREHSIKTVRGSGTQETEPVEWSAETGVIGADNPDKKYISKISVRLSLEFGTVVRIYIQYNSGGDWESVCVLTGSVLRSFSIPIRPKRCDHLRIRITGRGGAKIYSITKNLEQGSDM